MLNNTESMRHLILAVGVLLSPHISGSSLGDGDATNGFDLQKPYKLFTMKNGMQGLVIQDQNATTAAATITLTNGTINSKILQERLEFLDHLLYMGNQKLSSATMFWEFAKNGSSPPKSWNNDELQGYIFGVTKRHLEIGVEMLVRHAFCRYCEKKATSLSELEGVSSTIFRKENRDIKVVSIPGDPYPQVIVGRHEKPVNEPLRDDLDISGSQEVYYNPPQLLVSAIGNQSLDELDMVVSKAFGDLQDDLGKENFEGWRRTWCPEYLGTISEVTKGEYHRLYMKFPIPAGLQTAFWKYYVPLLRYKCSKCLSGYLKRRGYANFPTMVWSHPTYRGYFSYWFIEASLWDEGFGNREEVVTAIFQYFELLRRRGAQKWFWDKQYTEDYVYSWLTYNKQPERKPDLVEFPKDKIEKISHYLVPSNVDIFLESPDFRNKTKYGLKIEGSLLKAISNAELNPELDFPEQLYEYPMDLEVINVTAEESRKGPELIYTSNYTELWHKIDGKFNVPKTAVTGILWNPSNPKSIWDTVLASVQEATLDQCVKNVTYGDDQLFGGHVFITWSEGKIEIQLTGLSSAVPHTLRKISKALVNCTLQEKQFQRIVHSVKNGIISRQKYGPCMVFDIYSILAETHWSDQERLDALESLTLPDLEEFHRRVFSQIKMKWLVYGNTPAEQAKQMIKELEGKLTEGKPKRLRNVQLNPRYIEVPRGTRWTINVNYPSTESNKTCTMLYFQSKKQTLKDSVTQVVITDLMRNLLSPEPLVNLAQAHWTNVRHALGSLMGVESVENPTVVQQEMENLLGRFNAINETVLKIKD